MKNRWLLTFLLSFSLFAQEGTQLTVFNDHQFQPEVYSFPKLVEAGVDAKGDLNLSVPVMTVPGRGGLNYNIAFSYQSGIKVDAQASWLGLGWNFDPGSITRDVKGHINGQKAKDGSELYGPDYTKIADDQPDLYYVTIPGKGTHEMLRANKPAFNDDGNGDIFLAPKNENHFYFTEYQPYKVEATSGAFGSIPEDDEDDSYDYTDYNRFVVTTDDGMRYVYGEPSPARHGDLSLSLEQKSEYISAWRLIAILDPNCPALVGEYNVIDLETLAANPGNWVYLEYEKVSSVHAVPDNYFLKTVHTPTHRAELTLRADNFRVNEWTNCSTQWKNISERPDHTRALHFIELYNTARSDNEVLQQKVKLLQDFELAPLSFSISEDNFTHLPKLTLKGIEFYGAEGGKMPGYQFDYAYNPSVKYQERWFDAFGYYNTAKVTQKSGSFFDPFGNMDDSQSGQIYGHSWGEYKGEEENYDGSAWSLTKITYPTGGSEEYYYQNDVISTDKLYLYFYNNTSSFAEQIPFTFRESTGNSAWHGDIRISGGARVAQIVKRDGDDSQKSLRSFKYENGRASGIPPKILTWLEWGNSWYEAETQYSERGKLGVYYDKIIENNNNETLIIKKHATDMLYGDLVFSPVIVPPLQSMVYKNNQHMVYSTNENSNMWGKVLSESIVPITGTGPEVVTEYDYDFNNYRYLGNAIQTSNIPGLDGYNYRQHLPNLRQTKTTQKYSENSDRNMVVTKSYEYHPTTYKIVSETVKTGSEIVTTYTEYAHDVYAALAGNPEWNYIDAVDGMRVNNQLGQVAKSYTIVARVTADGEQSPKITGASINTFKAVDIGIHRQDWKNDRTYQLNLDDNPEEVSSFSNWDGTGSVSASWQKGAETLHWDDYGQPLEIRDPLGNTMKLYYGSNGNYFENNTAYANAYITGLQLFKDGQSTASFSRKLDYNLNNFKPERIYDENGNSRRYEYDEFQRLVKEKNSNNEVLTDYDIYFAFLDGNYNHLHPNFIKTTAHIDDEKTLTSKAFVNGLGQSMQSVTINPDGLNIFTATDFDHRGRAYRAYKNYANSSEYYDPEYDHRKPDGSLYELNYWHKDIQVSCKYYDEDHPSESVTIPMSELPDGTVSFRWNSTFFDLDGEVHCRVYLDDVLIQEELHTFVDASPEMEVETFSTLINLEKDISKSEVRIELQIGETGVFPENGKHYIVSTARLMDFYGGLSYYFTQFEYFPNTEEVSRTFFPGTGVRPRADVSWNESELELDDLPLNLGHIDWSILESATETIRTSYDHTEQNTSELTFTCDLDQPLTTVWKTDFQEEGEGGFSIEKISGNSGFQDIFMTHAENGPMSVHDTYQIYAGDTYRLTTFVNFPAHSNTAPCDGCGEDDDPGNGGGGGIDPDDGDDPDESERLGYTELQYSYQVRTTYTLPQYYTKKTYKNEIGQLRHEYYDVSGRKVADMAEKEDGSKVITAYAYDLSGNLTKVYHPNYFNPPFASEAGDWITEYKYNTLGQMLWKDTPDDGRTEYQYDRAGRLRFSQNAKQRLEGKVSFSSYDFAGRILKTGVADADFSALDADQTQAFESDTNTILAFYVYDKSPSNDNLSMLAGHIAGNWLSNGSWMDIADYQRVYEDLENRMLTAFTYNNPKGHLTAAAAKSGDKWEIELYSYDNENRVDNKHILVQGLRDNAPSDFDRTMISYSYNRQGMVTMRSVQFNNDSQFHHHFTYNGLMQLEKVYTSRTPINPASPGQPDATYTYNVQGLVEKVHLHTEGSGFDMDYAYNLRDWVTGIGDVDNSSHAFWARYDYLANGNIATSEYFNKMSQEPHFKYDYTYDGLNRLTTAAYATFGGSSWTAKPDFGVSNLSYDDMGNILSLKRHSNSSSVADDLSYDYSHNNRLHSVSDGMGKTDSWDAQSGLYHYDALGNVTATWKQDDGSYQFMPMNAINLPEHFETANEADGYIEITGNAWVSGSRTGNLALTDNAQAKTTITFNDRGLNVITMSSDGQSVIDDRNFDMYNNGSSSKEGDALAAYLEALPGSDHIIVIGLYDSGANAAYGEPQQEWTEAAYLAMEKLGAGRIRELKLRDGYVFAVTAGQPHTAMEDLQVYDAANNLTAPSLRYPVSISSKAHYRYNLAGQRIYKKVGNGKAEYYIMDGDVNLGVVDEDGVLQHWNIYGNDLLGRFERRSIYEPQPATDVIQQKDVAKDLGLTGKEEDTSWKIDGNSKDEKVTSLTTGTHAIEITGKDADGQTSTKTENVLVKPKMVDKKFWYLKDHLGSTRAVIDEENTIVETSDYYPFGLQMPGKKYLSNAKTTKEGFTGKERDKHSGLDYFGARYYDAGIGKWLSVDPLADNFMNLSPYNYCFNNPIRLIDDDGLSAKDRVKYAKEQIGIKYLMEDNKTNMRTASSKKALEYMDCSEFVCRVMAKDDLTNGVKHMNTVALKTYFEDNNYIKSKKPKIGDIALWKGHVGIVTGVKDGNKIKLTHARGEGKLSIENKYAILPESYTDKEFIGYYRPLHEGQEYNTVTPISSTKVVQYHLMGIDPRKSPKAVWEEMNKKKKKNENTKKKDKDNG
jgi:RHS repeat-associated protein